MQDLWMTGRLFGNRHTQALHAREADEEKRDPSVLEDLEALTSMGHGTPSSKLSWPYLSFVTASSAAAVSRNPPASATNKTS